MLVSPARRQERREEAMPVIRPVFGDLEGCVGRLVVAAADPCNLGVRDSGSGAGRVDSDRVLPSLVPDLRGAPRPAEHQEHRPLVLRGGSSAD